MSIDNKSDPNFCLPYLQTVTIYIALSSVVTIFTQPPLTLKIYHSSLNRFLDCFDTYIFTKSKGMKQKQFVKYPILVKPLISPIPRKHGWRCCGLDTKLTQNHCFLASDMVSPGSNKIVPWIYLEYQQIYLNLFEDHKNAVMLASNYWSNYSIMIGITSLWIPIVF